MPSDHAEVILRDVRVPHSAIVGQEGHGLAAAMLFVHENRIRQAASSLGAAQFCINQCVEYARSASRSVSRWPSTRPSSGRWWSSNRVQMLRGLIRDTAEQMDEHGGHRRSRDQISMCNYRANRLVCEAADRAIQVHGGLGYTRAPAVRAHLPPPPSLPHHRGLGGDPDPQHRPGAVRVREAVGLGLPRSTVPPGPKMDREACA